MEYMDKPVGIAYKVQAELAKYGSVETIANIMFWFRHHYESFYLYDSDDPTFLDEYLLGLFLSHNNLESGEPVKAQIDSLHESLKMLFVDNHDALFSEQTSSDSDAGLPPSIFKYHRIGHRDTPLHLAHKKEYYSAVFSPLDDHFMSRFGFSVNDVMVFVDEFITHVIDESSKKWDMYKEHYEYFQELTKKPKTAWLESCLGDELMESELNEYCYNAFYIRHSADLLCIDPDAYAKGNTISKERLSACLKAFSCKLGQQFEGFEGINSDNMIFYKPIIMIDEKKFFLPKPEILRDRLDRALEYLLEEERLGDTDVWKKFVALKSDYIKDRTIKLLSRVFPQKHIFEDLYYDVDGKRKNTGPCIIYDNKVIVANTSYLFLHEIQKGHECLYKVFGDMISKSLHNTAQVLEYARSPTGAEFHTGSGNVITLDSKRNYEFFFIDVTTESAGVISTNLKNIDMLDCFGNGTHPWSVNLHDLGIITDVLNQPIYFIHYLEHRDGVQHWGLRWSPYELAFLGNYLMYGYHSRKSKDMPVDRHVDRYQIPVDRVDTLKSYCKYGKDMPKRQLHATLEKLLLNMQKYYQRDFTKVTGLLLDFPNANNIYADIEQALRTAKPNSWNATSVWNDVMDIGFTYVVGYGMDGFYKHVSSVYKKHKEKYGITRWAAIGRNLEDMKNYATFFFYDDAPVYNSKPSEDSINE